MPMVPMRQILDEAANGGYGVGAFNVNNMEQVQAIMAAAQKTNSPVIIQASRGALKYSKMIYLKKLMEAAVEDNPEIPVALHLDHGNSLETCQQAIELGFTSVMMDGSLKEDGKTPRLYHDNVDVTKAVVEMAHAKGVTVEAELGCLGGIEDGHGAGLSDKDALKHLTDPAQAEEFVKLTGVDALAVAIGTSHGAFKSSNRDSFGKVLPPTLAMNRIVSIHERMPHCHMVMHGSSSLPAELIALANAFHVVGIVDEDPEMVLFMGEIYNLRDKFGYHAFLYALMNKKRMPNMQGIPLDQIVTGIQNGVRKINVDTDSRLAITGTIGKIFAQQTGKFDPRDYLGPAREANTNLVAERMIAFGQAGHAGDYTPTTLEAMKDYYTERGR